jgi:hypothetical protein
VADESGAPELVSLVRGSRASWKEKEVIALKEDKRDGNDGGGMWHLACDNSFATGIIRVVLSGCESTCLMSGGVSDH